MVIGKALIDPFDLNALKVAHLALDLQRAEFRKLNEQTALSELNKILATESDLSGISYLNRVFSCPIALESIPLPHLERLAAIFRHAPLKAVAYSFHCPLCNEEPRCLYADKCADAQTMIHYLLNPLIANSLIDDHFTLEMGGNCTGIIPMLGDFLNAHPTLESFTWKIRSTRYTDSDNAWLKQALSDHQKTQTPVTINFASIR